MLSLYRDTKKEIVIDGVTYPIDCSFNVVLANMDLSQNKEINDVVKIIIALENYLNVDEEQIYRWSVEQVQEIYNEICLKIFNDGKKLQSSLSTKKEDKSAYSFTEDADFIYASFMKDYGINLIKERNKMAWDEFKALFIGLSSETKIAEVIKIRQWEPSKEDSKERIASMKELQKMYALDSTQQQIEEIEIERQKMASMSSDERIKYANEMRKKLEGGG